MDATHTRRWAGAGAMVAVVLAADLLLPDLGDSAAWSLAQSVLVPFLSALAGAWVARGRFVVPALVVWALVWAVVTWVLHGIAPERTGPSVAAILQYNWLEIVLSLAATVFGAWSGQLLARAPTTTT